MLEALLRLQVSQNFQMIPVPPVVLPAYKTPIYNYLTRNLFSDVADVSGNGLSNNAVTK